MGRYPIAIRHINSAGIQEEAARFGITHAREIGRGEHAGARCTLYAMLAPIGEIRVLATNGYPVWEEQDPADFAADLAYYGIE